MVHCQRLDAILQREGVTSVDFFSLDVEGAEESVLETADGDRGRVIGRQGRVAKALRAILNATADGAGARLDIVD